MIGTPIATRARTPIDAAKAQWTRPVASSVSLSLPFPPSVNRLWTRGRSGMIKTPRYETWFQAAGLELNAQRPRRVPGVFTARILIELKDRRRRDLDNMTKAIFDLLQAHQVVEDDSLLAELTLGWSATTRGAWIELTARPDLLTKRQPQKVAA